MTWWSFHESKKESMPNKIHEVNMHARNFQGPKLNEKEIPSENRIPNGEISTWKVSLKIHQGMRYPLIHTKRKISNSQKREWFQTNQALYKVS